MYDYAHGMLVLRRGGGAAADQSAEECEGEGGRQSAARPVYCTGSATRRMSLAFARDA